MTENITTFDFEGTTIVSPFSKINDPEVFESNDKSPDILPAGLVLSLISISGSNEPKFEEHLKQMLILILLNQLKLFFADCRAVFSFFFKRFSCEDY